MRKLALLALAAVTAIIPSPSPKPKISLVFTMKGHVTRDNPAVTSDGRRIYYLQDSTELLVYDRTTRRSAHVLDKMIGGRTDVVVSPAGDRLAFCRNGEDGDGPQLWTVALDRTSGLPNGAPRRVSLLPATDPSFSPDGKSIAFGARVTRVAENLVIVPVNGGPERVLAETEGDIWPIRWIDKDSIYFGLSFNGPKDAGKNGVYRIALTGGTPKLVMRTADWGTNPGLSPDGRFIIAADSTWDSVIVATASGKRLSAYAPNDGNKWPDIWSSSTHAIGSYTVTPRVVHVMNLADGKDRTISDSADYLNPQWSQDGRRVMSLQVGLPNVVVSDVSGGSRRRIGMSWVPGPFASVALSPDNRSVFYQQRQSPRAIHLVDVGSGKHIPLVSRSTLGPLPQWRSDSRAILYAVVDSVVGPDSIKTIEIHEVATSGKDRVLDTVKTQCSGGRYCGRFIDDSLLSTWAGGEYRVTNFRSRREPRLVFTRSGSPMQPVPSFSSNGRWMSVRRQSASGGEWSIELMRLDGTSRKTIPLSFAVTPGAQNPWIRPDGLEVIVASGECPTPGGACTRGLTFYRIDVQTGKAIVIATTPPATQQGEDYRISPDGRSLAYIVELQPYVDFLDFDFSEMLKGR